MRRRHDQPPEIPDDERRRITGAILRRVQWGAAVFLVVVTLGALPEVLSRRWPAAGLFAAKAIWIVAPALTIAMLVVAAFRMRR